ncbi:uncharacterized protein Z519_09967 [Cladophialophora bantiana CBS 173.52]|uniref:aldehyde dehydrogenase (NAD(+)) n=1 Tax=Cladophialophora bantiana (strain ATCC 10958 / CBS 173.52 / CDC B-1940 / NIH 8579) TaxID=1442370 RepID=A0A0D2HE66_CLAB1|nr:uncharacterized protein Z519_09967 [Cladophialophora bantiana CBS 173.52]KIW89115.1 hypothetical protein Z519_09967 [Cladophialophora bantiana CBS 173.52]
MTSKSSFADFEGFGKYYNIIDGKLSETPSTTHNINPATGKANAEVPLSRPQDVDDAMKAAQCAFKYWAKVPFAHYPRQVAFAKGQIAALVGWIRTLPDIDLRDEIIQEDDEKLTITRYTPLGVAVGFVPWNFPIHIGRVKIIPLVLAGNPIMIKPSPVSPYCNLKLVELAQQFFPSRCCPSVEW